MSTSSVQRIAAVTMLVLAALLIAAVFTAETPSTLADEFPEDFEDLVTDETTYLIGQAVQIAVGVLVAVLGGSLYTLLRGRDRFLPLIGFTGFLGLGLLFVSAASFYINTHALAQDLSREETIADEDTVMEIGRQLVATGDGLFFVGIIFFALGLLAFGSTIILSARAAAPGVEAPSLQPPAWIGWLAVAAGVLYLLGWFVVLVDIFFIGIALGFLLTIIWYASLGVWTLMRAKPAAEPA